MAEFYVYGWYADEACTDIFYVGKGTKNRQFHWKDLRRNLNTHLVRKVVAVRRAIGFVPTRRLHDGLTNQEALQTEIKLIAQFGRNPAGPLLNLTDGGVGGPIPLESQLRRAEKMRGRPAHNKGKPMPLDQRIHLRNMFEKGHAPWNKGQSLPYVHGMLGREHTIEARQRMSAAKKGRPPPNKGKKMPSAQVEAMRGRRLGAVASEETRRRISESSRRYALSAEGRASKAAASNIRWARVRARAAQIRSEA